MDTLTLSPTQSAGLVRLRLQATTGRWLTVGPFGSLTGARALAQDLIAQQAVKAVRVERKNRGTWRPAWSFLAGLSLLLITGLAATEAQAACQSGWKLIAGNMTLGIYQTHEECERAKDAGGLRSTNERWYCTCAG